MRSVNFYLKKPLTKPGEKVKADAPRLIYLQFKYNSNRLVYSFNQTIKPVHWNYQKQRVKSNKITTADGDYALNDLLDNLALTCERTYKEELKRGIPAPSLIKSALNNLYFQNSHNEEKGLFALIDRFISGEIKSRGKDKSVATLNNYKSVKKHLTAFSKKFKYPLSFESINLDFFYKYTAFLAQEGAGYDKDQKPIGLSPNSIAKDIRLLKVFLAEAIDLGWSKNHEFRNKKFSISGEETDAVYLTEKEILALYRLDLTKNKRLEEVRDLFVFGCFVGLRFSDYNNVRPENIVQHDGEIFIKLITAKTNELVIVPCNPVVVDIFRKYDLNPNKLPKSLSNQKFNDYIKEACKAAGLFEKGRLSTEPSKGLWECVSSHTARRSFATNLYLAGFPTIDLMKITGHKTEKAFMKYIRITKLDTAKRLSAHIKKNWTETLLRIAG